MVFKPAVQADVDGNSSSPAVPNEKFLAGEEMEAGVLCEETSRLEEEPDVSECPKPPTIQRRQRMDLQNLHEDVLLILQLRLAAASDPALLASYFRSWYDLCLSQKKRADSDHTAASPEETPEECPEKSSGEETPKHSSSTPPPPAEQPGPFEPSRKLQFDWDDADNLTLIGVPSKSGEFSVSLTMEPDTLSRQSTASPETPFTPGMLGRSPNSSSDAIPESQPSTQSAQTEVGRKTAEDSKPDERIRCSLEQPATAVMRKSQRASTPPMNFQVEPDLEAGRHEEPTAESPNRGSADDELHFSDAISLDAISCHTVNSFYTAAEDLQEDTSGSCEKAAPVAEHNILFCASNVAGFVSKLLIKHRWNSSENEQLQRAQDPNAAADVAMMKRPSFLRALEESAMDLEKGEKLQDKDETDAAISENWSDDTAQAAVYYPDCFASSRCSEEVIAREALDARPKCKSSVQFFHRDDDSRQQRTEQQSPPSEGSGHSCHRCTVKWATEDAADSKPKRKTKRSTKRGSCQTDQAPVSAIVPPDTPSACSSSPYPPRNTSKSISVSKRPCPPPLTETDESGAKKSLWSIWRCCPCRRS